MSFKHGLSNSREYWAWGHMKSRCFNPNARAFKNYGGRGITVCVRWKESFKNFFADMGPCPVGMSIERRNNDGNYEPRNCVWADRIAQANNRRQNRVIEYLGKRQTAAEWARELKVSRDLIITRLRAGFALQEVFSREKFIHKRRPSAPKRRGNSRLSEKQVLKIRALAASGKFTQLSIADRFGIGQVTVSHIVRGDTWKDLLQ